MSEVTLYADDKVYRFQFAEAEDKVYLLEFDCKMAEAESIRKTVLPLLRTRYCVPLKQPPPPAPPPGSLLP